MNIRTLVAASLLAVAAAPSFAQTNLLADGDFEAFSGMVGGGDYRVVNAGATLGGWTVGGTSVDLVKNRYGAITGTSVDLNGTPGPGSLSQSFNAVAGQTYTLNFDYWQNKPGVGMTVSFGGQSYTYTPGDAPQNTTLSWTATMSGSQMVVFSGTGKGNQGTTLDNVSLITAAVPEPSSLALMLGGFAAIGGVVVRRRQAK